MNLNEMTAKIANDDGFIAALDQSGGSTPKALRGYGVEDHEWSTDVEMFQAIHDMRCRVITSPSFSKGQIIGAILFEKTMEGFVDGLPTADALKNREIVPFIKVDEGLAEESNGVQLMREMSRLDELLEKAVSAGVFGTKMRSVIKSANPEGIAEVINQQFEIGKRILKSGLVPIIEPEFDISANDRRRGEDILAQQLLDSLDCLTADQRVILKLSIPVEPNLYGSLIAHSNVLRVVALSGGYSTVDACKFLSQNKGMIASFSRGLLQDLRKSQTTVEFDDILGKAISQIADASSAG